MMKFLKKLFAFDATGHAPPMPLESSVLPPMEPIKPKRSPREQPKISARTKVKKLTGSDPK